MLMNPAAQDQAQAEIDRVIGTDRLPIFDDEPNLPYVSALSKELLRWEQGAPFGTFNGSMLVLSYLILLLSSDPTSPDERRYLQRLLHPKELYRPRKRMVCIHRYVCVNA